MESKITVLTPDEIEVVSGADNPEPTCSSDGDTTSCSCPAGYEVTIDLNTQEITCEPAD